MKHLLSRWVVAFVSGAIFALGLAVSRMTQPGKVVAFLDVTGAWDPSLALVMAGAIGVFLPAYFVVRRRRAAPVLARRFHVPPATRPVDGRLVAGAAIFGAGWGLSGLCPGPALVSTVTGAAGILVFVGAMIAGAMAVRFVTSRGPQPASAARSMGRAGT